MWNHRTTAFWADLTARDYTYIISANSETLEEVTRGEDVDADSGWDFEYSTIEKGVQ